MSEGHTMAFDLKGGCIHVYASKGGDIDDGVSGCSASATVW